MGQHTMGVTPMLSRRVITYSPAYTLVPTYECFNRCTYCNFRVNPGEDRWLTLAEAEDQLRSLQLQGVIEILILSGEIHPRSSRRGEWIQRIVDLGALALALGFLPHTNAGPLSFEEMEQLKPVNVSMGLMVEQVTPRLLETVHRHAPSKVPALRLQQLEWAGELGIPFTTGLLLGIGETEQERRETLEAIARLQRQYGHIQEVILQPYRLGQRQDWQVESCSEKELVRTVAIARETLPDDVTLQIPPNLTHPDVMMQCIEMGARDLGGIGPKDEVNPDYPHPHDRELAAILTAHHWQLVPRLPIYPQYDDWLSPSLGEVVARWRTLLA